jgi:predicted ester cyclase
VGSDPGNNGTLIALPTGKPITFTGVNVDRIIDGKIVEHGGAANLLDPLLKAGVIAKT